jgi:hypothetical protein
VAARRGSLAGAVAWLALWALWASVVTVAGGLGCRPPEASAAPPQPTSRPAFPWAQVVVETPRGDVTLRVEVARTDRERTHGLMFKEHLAEDEGMVFLFDRTEEHVFWMKNTPLPLDMLFLGDDRRVVGIRESAEPLSLTRVTVGVPSRYVLEVRGGWARAHGVGKGALVRFLGVE